MLQAPALYYPYIHVRDDEWLKAAALYWPSIRRLVPSAPPRYPRPLGYAPDYPTHDSDTARTFSEAGVLRAENPGRLVDAVAWDLVSHLRSNAGELIDRYNVERATSVPWRQHETFDERSGVNPRSPMLGWIHVSKFDAEVLSTLEELGLAVPAGVPTVSHGDPGTWIGLHPVLAGAYMTALAGKMSEAAHFQPLTDQPGLARSVATTDAGGALNLLTGARSGISRALPDPDSGVATYVLLSVQTVRPDGLEFVPAEDILRLREDLAEELAAFRAYVSDQATELAQLATIPIAERRIEAFNDHVAQTIEAPLQRLERGMALHRMTPTRSLLLAGSYSPPALAAAALGSASPLVLASVGVLAAVGSAWWDVKRQRTTARTESPVGYLLDVRDRLTPRTLARQAKRLYTGTF